jgi:hypothetical protein
MLLWPSGVATWWVYVLILLLLTSLVLAPVELGRKSQHLLRVPFNGRVATELAPLLIHLAANLSLLTRDVVSECRQFLICVDLALNEESLMMPPRSWPNQRVVNTAFGIPL